jgi:hypothetical protein
MVADTIEELYLFKIGQSPYDIFSLPQYASFFFGIGNNWQLYIEQFGF